MAAMLPAAIAGLAVASAGHQPAAAQTGLPTGAPVPLVDRPDPVGAVGAAMVDRTQLLLAQLDPGQRDSATFSFDSRTRQAWNYMLGARTAPGLSLERMSPDQRAAALDLLATALSPAGMDKADRVMVLQDVLGEMAGRPHSRSRDRFSIAIFGTPSTSQPWGWRFEGHHLTLSFTLFGDRVVSVTPSSFSSNPNEVAAGTHRGLVALVEEEVMGRRLFADLSPANRRRALIGERGFGNVLALAGREDSVANSRAGVPVAEMTPAQQDLLMQLVEVYTVDHLTGPLAAEQRTRIREGDVMAARFAWAGSEHPGETIYYRLHGDAFMIEFASLRNQPLHLHTIYHDFERNLGAHVLG